MIDKFKQWLGIEGVKLQLLVPEEIPKNVGFVDGRIVFRSKNTQTVTELTIKIIEIYSRGRGNDQKVDEYEIGRIAYLEPIEISPYEETHLDFALPYQLQSSDMDSFGDQNMIAKGISLAAKALYKVESKYRIVASATVKGTALHPFDKVYIRLS